MRAETRAPEVMDAFWEGFLDGDAEPVQTGRGCGGRGRYPGEVPALAQEEYIRQMGISQTPEPAAPYSPIDLLELDVPKPYPPENDTLGRWTLNMDTGKLYWNSPGALEAEAWAQFGRIQFQNDSAVVQMLQEGFPNFFKNAIITLKEVM